ncbi:STAS domain-containing protein [Mycobacterium sp. NPDC050551]|uniref:STAS domain-containing protein n=1 Tax=Mycobacterium sp. NPDC050551 TaxID=3155407 RepID=UPI00343B78D4
MALRSVDSTPGVAFRYGNPATDCDGVRMRACCRQLATVVTVSGDIDTSNANCVRAYAKRNILAEKPLVIDMSSVTSFSVQAVELLFDLDDDCYRTGVEWALIASPPVLQALRATGPESDFPLVGSVPEAMHHFREGILARRRLLPLLTKTA